MRISRAVEFGADVTHDAVRGLKKINKCCQRELAEAPEAHLVTGETALAHTDTWHMSPFCQSVSAVKMPRLDADDLIHF